MINNVCCIFNLAPHYRLPIFQLMDSELNCDFYFGDKVDGEIKKLDYKKLKGFKRELKNKSIFKTSFKWQKGILPLLLKNRYKTFIITGDPYYLSNWAIIIIGKILGKKIIPWSHGMTGSGKNKMEWFEKLFFQLCPIVLLYGNYSRNKMIEIGFDEKKLVCIYNSLDYEQQVKIRRTLKNTSIYNDYFNNSFPTIIYIGRIQSNKNLESLVEVTKLLNEKGIFCNLVFIGKDIGNNDVVKTAEKLDLNDKIWFYGPCYEEAKIGELLFNAEICVSPGPVGLTALHSLTYGTPVVSNNNFEEQMPEFEVIEEGKTGSFFIKDNLEDLSSKIEFWLNQTELDRIKVRSNCYQVIENNWNPKSQIETLKQII